MKRVLLLLAVLLFSAGTMMAQQDKAAEKAAKKAEKEAKNRWPCSSKACKR